MRVNELKKILKKSGCYLEREGANHEIWYSPITQQAFSVSRHGNEELKPKTLNSIMKAAGIK